MIKGVIFDLDGVICFTDNYHYLAWKKIANEEGIYFNKEINNMLRGVSRMDSLEIILRNSKKEYKNEEKMALAEKKNNIYKEYLKEMNKASVSIDVIETLKYLKDHKIKIAIGSSSKNTKFILERIGLLDMFDEIVDGNDITNSKPNPEVFLKAANKINEYPSNCFVVEDAISGIDAGFAGGFVTVAIGDAKKNPKANYKINKISDIIKLI